MKYQFTRKSRNRKTGPIPVTMTERKSCPVVCPFKDAGCYADGFPLSLHWGRVATDGISLKTLCTNIASLPDGQLWRMNAAGDLPGDKTGKIAPVAVDKIVTANAGKKGFTYCHHDTNQKENRDIIADANKRGFTINLSGNNLTHADKLMKLKIGPVVTVMGAKAKQNIFTPDGHRVVICPAVTGKTESCATCGLCADAKRKTIIGFPAHGNRKRLADTIATGGVL